MRGRLYTLAADTIARPNNATPYAAKDVVGENPAALLTFTGLALAGGGGGRIVKARLATDKKDEVGAYRLHLFNAPPTPIVDNSPFLLLYADVAKRIGSIDFAALTTEDATGSTMAESLNATVSLPFVAAVGNQGLYGVLVALGTPTPAANQAWYVELLADVQ